MQTNGLEVWIDQTSRPFSFSSPFGGLDFALMLVVADPTVTNEERRVISDAVVQAGCRYAVCTGHDCSMWDDSIDFAFLSTSPDFEPPDARFVMTTWHENQSLDDVAFYLRFCTAFAEFVPERFLVTILGGDTQLDQQVRTVIEHWFV